MKSIRLYILIVLIVLLLAGCTPKQEKQFNVLMIAVDDLRPELGCYGNRIVKSPNIDQLADMGVLFENSYCNSPVSGASRASLLTGSRPTKNRFIHYYTRADVEIPEAVCLSQHFKNNGYTTVSNGKVFHHFDDRSESWDENWRPKTNATWRDYHIDKNVSLELKGGGPPFEIADVHDTIYYDGKLAEKTISDLKKLKAQNKPFFLAAGFVKPHLPFNAPKKYWDMYSSSDFKPTKRAFWPLNAPKEAFHNSGELRAYHGVPEKGFISDSASVQLQHGYYACISYIDAQIGKILEAIEELGLATNTIVMLWGDHGWNLGEHGLWCKHCNFNTSLKAPLIIKAPGYAEGKLSPALTEFIDIFPTLCELCNLEIPESVEGKSLVPLLENPEEEWTDYVICKYHDGLTIKTSEYAYTEWRDNKDSLISAMLFDHVNDINETNNLINDSEFIKIRENLSKKLHENKGRNYYKTNALTTNQ